MKRSIRFFVILVLVVLAACDTDEEIACYPQRVTTTTPNGSGATAITADYKYEGEKLDHIIWSNFQTHYFSYDEAGRLQSVARKNVQTFQKQESIVQYDNELISGTKEYLVSLDYFTQEDVDTTYSGYREFEYEGIKIRAEKVFGMEEASGQMILKEYKEYGYDYSGNVSSYVCLDDIDGDTIEAYTYTYDAQRNPFSSLSLLFEGETFINNKIQTVDLLSGDVYNHQIVYESTKFPEQIIIKLESYNTEVIRITYTCD